MRPRGIAVGEESRSHNDFLTACQVILYSSPPPLKSTLAASYHILLGQIPLLPPLISPQRTSPMEEQPTTTISPMPSRHFYLWSTQSPWTGPEELKLKLHFVIPTQGFEVSPGSTPSESPKVMGLMGIHDPDAFCWFSSVTYCPWCRKEGQNEGTVVNHLWTTHYRLGLVCDMCYSCPSTMSDTFHWHGWLNCCWLGESIPSKSGPST